MKLLQFKQHLKECKNLVFVQPNGVKVPLHFHITEAARNIRDFIDCGGTVRHDTWISFQIWIAHDYDHRLQPQKLIDIIEKFESSFGSHDDEVEIEYQNETIGRYGLIWSGDKFQLTIKHTECLSPDKCGIPESQLASSPASAGSSCTPGGGCC